VTREVVLAARPEGEPKESDFEIRESTLPSPGEGELLVRNVYVSVDPYMRSRMTGVRTYVPPYDIGGTIDGGAVGRVVESNDERYAPGDWVVSQLGWCEHGLVPAHRVRKIDASVAPPSYALGLLGMPGFTAWIGLVDIGQVREGETIYVSGAGGAVGSAAAQIARLIGLRVIGSAGTAEKVDWLRSLGIEAFNYRETPAKEGLGGGIDIYFDNVGGSQLEAALFALRDHGRVIACGSIARYNDVRPEPGPRNLSLIVTKRLRVQGFIIIDHYARFPEFLAEVAPWVLAGQLDCRETIVDGIENIPAAFAGLFRGDNIGKMLVRVGPAD
jgi:NADPH-dependent curcumin reductase CurA